MSFGLPNLANINNVANNVILLGADLISIIGMNTKVFAINLSGTHTSAIIAPDSFISFDVKSDYTVSDYPIEKGSFSQYNKVKRPPITQVRLAKGGALSVQHAFIRSISQLAASVTVVDVMINSQVYTTCSITSYNITKTATNGAGITLIDVTFEAIIQTATATFTNTVAPDGHNPANTGPVSTSPASSTLPTQTS